jgi:hypothetical protein
MYKSSGQTDVLIRRLALKITSIIEKRLKEDLVSICLFGSAARGKVRRGSDIDLLVVLKNAPTSYHKRIKIILPFLEEIRETKEYHKLEEKDLYLEPSFLLLADEEVKAHPPVLIDISYEGLILYDRGNFLKNHLVDIKERLNKLGARRKNTPEGHYWLLKPDLKAGELFEI